MARYKSFGDVQSHLDELGMFHMNLGLERMQAFVAAFEACYGRGPAFRIAHVVGTNGKGSTSAFLENIARCHGLRTGLYTSPHFVSPRERIHVNGSQLGEAEWVELANETFRLTETVGPTYFEFLTCLAVLAFERAGVQLAVMEAGLGGRYDATNVLAPDWTLFTPIGLDHEAVLGGTVAAITEDKADAMRTGAPAFTAPQVPEAMTALRRRADELDVALTDTSGFPLPDERGLGMKGPHQPENARLAMIAWEQIAKDIGVPTVPAYLEAALAATFVPGRLQFVPAEVGNGRPAFLLDGAHNEHALIALRAALRAQSVRPAVIIFNCMRDKRLEAMLPLLLGMGDGPVLVPGIPGNERAAKPEDTAATIGTRAAPVDDMAAALDHEAAARAAATGGMVLVCGSLYLLAEFYKLNPRLLGDSGVRGPQGDSTT